MAGTTTNYSRNVDAILDQMNQTIAQQKSENARLRADLNRMQSDISQERRDAVRYSRVHELGRTREIDVDDVLAANLDVPDAQFDVNLAQIEKYSKPRSNDILDLEIYDDPGLQVERYNRMNGRSGPNAQELAKYSREAAQEAARLNEVEGHKPGRFDEVYAAKLRENGVAV